MAFASRSGHRVRLVRGFPLVVVLLACGRTEPVTFVPPVAEAPSPPDAFIRDAGTDRDSGHVDAGPIDAGSMQGIAKTDLIYVNDERYLYTFSPSTNALARIKEISCSPATDIAIDRNGVGFVISNDVLYRIDLQTGVCSEPRMVPERLVALQFLPAGVVNPTEEGLIGYGDTSYWQFDPRTGTPLRLGRSALGPSLAVSGDLTALNDGGTFLTVNGGSCADCLLAITPQTGAVERNFGAMGIRSVWGMATWDDRIFGFTSEGGAFQIDFTPGGGVSSRLISSFSPLSFWGAAARPRAGPLRDGGP